MTPVLQLPTLSAWQMAEGIRAGNFTPTELLEAHLRQIERWNPKLNAFVCIDEDRARLAAKNADEAAKAANET